MSNWDYISGISHGHLVVNWIAAEENTPQK